MPHHPAAFHGRLAVAQPLHHLAGRAKLLVAAHHLHTRATVGVHHHRAGAQNVQQVGLGEHARHQLLLRVQASQRRVVLRVEGFPGVEVLVARGDGAKVGQRATGAHQQQVAVKQPGLALFQPGGLGFGAAAHVALQLHKRLLHGVGAGFRTLFALHHHQRYAVHTQHDVGNHERLHAARRVHPKLVDGMKPVVGWRVEVNQPHHRVGLARQLVAVGLCLEQQGLHRLVGLQQRAVGVAGELGAQIVQLPGRQPGLAAGGGVDGPHRFVKHTGQQGLAKVLAQAGGCVLRHARALVNHRPALGGQLVQEGAFDFGVFAHVIAANLLVASELRLCCRCRVIRSHAEFAIYLLQSHLQARACEAGSFGYFGQFMEQKRPLTQ